MVTYPPNQTTPNRGSSNYLWNWLGSSLKKFAAALQPYLGGGNSYNTYVAFLTQNGIDPPVATVVENTIGNIVWTYDGVGNYKGILAGAFPSGKRWSMAIGDALSGDFVQIGFGDDSTIQIWNYDLFSPGGPLIDDTAMYIEIRVYP